MKIGFIGLGIMGKPMAKNLIKNGYEVFVSDLNEQAVEEVIQFGAKGSLAQDEMASSCDVIFTILPNGVIVENVIIGPKGLVHNLKEGAIVVDMSSVSPSNSQKIESILEEKNVSFFDAPVSGGEPKAIDGTLVFMVGGKEEEFHRIEPLLLSMGVSATLVGKCGSGSVTKLANQIMVNLHIAAMSEALVLATKAGVDPEKVFKAIRGGLAGSAVFEAKAPLVFERNFQPGGRIDINMKDITNVMMTAHDLDVPLPLSSLLLEIMKALKVDGKATDDHGGIIQYYEKLAQVEVKPHKE